jgi:TolB-like protein
MKKCFASMLLMVFALVANAKTIAISYFDNTSGDVKYNALSKGIADMLITDLSKIKGVSIVEREKLEKLVQEIKLEQSKYFDAATAQKLGKGLGAQNILTGSFYLLDNTLRIDARLIDVQTGGIILAEQVTGSKNNFFALHQQLATLLSKKLNIPYSPDLSGLYKPSEEVSLTAVVNYSNAIELQDQGMNAAAQNILEQTVKTYPKFNFAKNKLNDLKELLKQVEEQRNLLIAQELKNSMTSLDPNSDKFGMQLTTIWSTLISSYKYSQILSFNNSLRSLKIDSQKKLYGDASPLTLNEMMLYYDCISLNALKKHDELLETGKQFISTYPLSLYFQGVKMSLEQTIKEVEQTENGKIGLQKKLDAEALDAYLFYLNKLRWKSNLQFTTETDYKHYQQLYKSQVLSASKEIVDIWDESTKFSEFTEFFDVAAAFNDVSTMEEIVTVSKKLFTGTNDEERALHLETKLDDYKTKSIENKKAITDLERIAKTGSKEELEKIIKWLFSNEKYNRPDLLLSICNRYINETKTVKDENEAEVLLKAWQGAIINTAKLKSLEDAQKSYETFKTKGADFSIASNAYEKEIKEINIDLKSLKNDYEAYLKNVKNNDPMINVLENYASIYKENYQYTEEAYTRKQLISLFKLDETKGSVQLFLLAMSYFNLGYFDNVRKTAAQLKEQYPSSTYNESLKSIVNFMPQ